MTEAILTTNSIEPTQTTNISNEAYTYNEQNQQTNSRTPVVICGWCGAVEQYISSHKTICPNCDE